MWFSSNLAEEFTSSLHSCPDRVHGISLNSPNVVTLLKRKDIKINLEMKHIFPEHEEYSTFVNCRDTAILECQVSLLPFELEQTTRMSGEVNTYLYNLHLQWTFLSASNSLKCCQKMHHEKVITVSRAISKVFKQILTQTETTFFVSLQWAMWILTYHHWKEHFLKNAASVLSERPHFHCFWTAKQMTHRRLEKLSPKGKKEFCHIMPIQSLNSDIIPNTYRLI